MPAYDINHVSIIICKTLNSNVDAKIRLSAPKSDGLASSLLLEWKLKSDGHDSDGNEKM